MAVRELADSWRLLVVILRGFQDKNNCPWSNSSNPITTHGLATMPQSDNLTPTPLYLSSLPAPKLLSIEKSVRRHRSPTVRMCRPGNNLGLSFLRGKETGHARTKEEEVEDAKEGEGGTGTTPLLRLALTSTTYVIRSDPAPLDKVHV